jgi:hypothetical protein
VYEATLPLFTEYGRLVTGLRRVELRQPSSREDGANPGVYGLERAARRNLARRRVGLAPGAADAAAVALRGRGEDAKEYEDDDEDDPVWEACLVLDRLERWERRNRAPAKLAAPAPLPPSVSAPPEPGPALLGRVPAVPWLDALSKARAEAVLREFCASSSREVNGDEKPRQLLGLLVNRVSSNAASSPSTAPFLLLFF